MQIAIVGAGISGLVAAYRLHSRHEITVFEAAVKPGGHTNTIPVEWDGESHQIDTGFIVYNEWTYPHFIELLNELRVPSQPTTMGFSVRDDATGLEYAGQSLNSLFAQRRNLINVRFLRMLADILRFNRQTLRMADQLPPQMTVAEFLAAGRYSEAFARQHLLPMGAAIWTCPLGTFSQFPIQFIIEFYRNHGLLNVVRRPTWRVITGGSQTYVDALTTSFRDRIRLSSPVTSVRRLDDEVEVQVRGEEPQRFDHVIFACHSDQALRILGSHANTLEREVLGQFPYSRNIAVLHTDESVLPRQRRAWASWNYRLTDDAEAPATVTYNMNMLQRLRSRHTFCVTLNDEASIDPARVLGRFEYHHPIFTTERSAAQARHHELLTANRTSFCGAYWRNGFHEDGVVSALRVVAALDASTSSWPGLRSKSSSLTGVRP
ncbi:FAD-dependent oxidoreductase [bacterium]|nr:FAD-dependent oxidoreductase [bacterium]